MGWDDSLDVALAYAVDPNAEHKGKAIGAMVENMQNRSDSGRLDNVERAAGISQRFGDDSVFGQAALAVVTNRLPNFQLKSALPSASAPALQSTP